MKKFCIRFATLFIGIVMVFSVAGCNAGSDDFQKKIDDLQSQIAEMEDKISERDATIEDLQEQIKQQEEKIKQLEKELAEKMPDENESTGTLYTLQEAYDNGLLTREDLMSIAYYHNGGRYHNQEIMGESYQPAPKIPEVLSDKTQLKIKSTAAKNYREVENIEDAKADGFTITRYYGTYGDCVAVMMKDDYTMDFQAVRKDIVAGVTISYPDSRELTIWRETKQAEDTKSVGSLYTLKEAYENGWLTQDDIMSIAYYHNRGRFHNEEIMSESYEPAPKTPEVLSEATELKIKITAAEEYRQKYNVKYAEAEGFTITEYCGTYGDCVAIITEDIYSGTTGAVWIDTIAGVNIYYNSGRTIQIWRETKQTDGEKSVGAFYTVEEAYDMDFLTITDLKDICYYRFGEVWEGNDFNSNNWTKIEYTPTYTLSELDKKIEVKIKETYYELNLVGNERRLYGFSNKIK